MAKKITVMHFVSGLGNDGVTQTIKNYTSRLNKRYNIREIVVYQHHTDSKKLDELINIGDEVYEIPYKKSHPFGNLIETYKIIKKIKPDIVHAHMSLLSFYPLAVAKFSGVKVRIAHAHIARDNVSHLLAPTFKRLNKLFANYYMACGQDAGKYLFGNSDFKILYNAIDQNKFRFSEKERSDLRTKYNIDQDTVVFGTLGRLTEQKNQKFIIDFFSAYNRKHPNSKLFIIGVGELKEQLVKKINSARQNKNVFMISGTTHPNVYYSMFDYFVLPSLYEGLPVSAIESQASGVNTLLANNIDKTVKYKNNVLFIPIDKGVDPWLIAIKKLSKNNREGFAENEKYNIEKQFSTLYKYYVNALNNTN